MIRILGLVVACCLLFAGGCTTANPVPVIKQVKQVVPDVRGKPEIQAKNVLVTAGYVVKESVPGCGAAGVKPEQVVEEQEPAAGTPYPKGSSVTLILRASAESGC